MREWLPEIEAWTKRARSFGLATLVAVEGSSPREVGAVLLYEPESGIFHGSVSSGCVENVLLERLAEVVGEDSAVHLEFGPEEVVPWAVGLTCGGNIRVRLERYFSLNADPVVREICSVWHQFMQEDEPGVLLSRGRVHCLMMQDGSILGSRSDWPAEALAAALELIASGGSSRLWDPATKDPIFLRVNRPRPRLFLVGAVHIAVEIARLAAAFPVRVIVLDPRKAYTRPERFTVPPHQLENTWPTSYWSNTSLGAGDAVVTLSHDPKIDDQALIAAIRAGCGYVGALGSQQSQSALRERLKAAGLSEAECARIRGPVAAGAHSREAGGIALGILHEWLMWWRGTAV